MHICMCIYMYTHTMYTHTHDTHTHTHTRHTHVLIDRLVSVWRSAGGHRHRLSETRGRAGASRAGASRAASRAGSSRAGAGAAVARRAVQVQRRPPSPAHAHSRERPRPQLPFPVPGEGLPRRETKRRKFKRRPDRRAFVGGVLVLEMGSPPSDPPMPISRAFRVVLRALVV